KRLYRSTGCTEVQWNVLPKSIDWAHGNCASPERELLERNSTQIALVAKSAAKHPSQTKRNQGVKMNHVQRANSMRGKSADVGHITRTIARLLAIAAAIFTVGVFFTSTVSAQSGSPPTTSSLIVKLIDGLSVEQQAAVV